MAESTDSDNVSLSSEQSSLGSSYSELEFEEEQTSIVEPYQYEPVDNTSSGDDTATEESPDVGRLLNTEWY